MAGLRQDFRYSMKATIPGMGRTENFLNRLGSVKRGENREWVKNYPLLHWPACRLLDAMGWWHYHIQRNACVEGSRLCWYPSHWHDGKLGPLAAELDRQMRKHEEGHDGSDCGI